MALAFIMAQEPLNGPEINKSMDKEILISIRNNPRKMRQEYLDSSGVTNLFDQYCGDDTFSKFNNRDKLDFILNGCINSFCEYCKIQRAKVGKRFCSAACVGKSNREILSEVQKANAPERMRKSRETMLTRYGVPHNNFLQSSRESRSEKRAQWVIDTRKETFEKYGLDIDKFGQEYTREVFNKCTTLSELSKNYFGNMPVMTILRFIHHIGLGEELKYEKTSSFGEREIRDFLVSILPGETVSFNDRSVIPGNLEIDVFVPDRKFGIEYHGLWCHVGNTSKERHLFKQNYLQSVDIGLMQIFEDEWDSKKDILKEIIKTRLGIFEETLFARKLLVRKVETKEARMFLSRYHLQGYINGNHLGLYRDQELVSIVSVGKSRFGNKDANWELLRYATKSGIRITGGFKKLLSNVKKMITSGDSLVSYCDRRLFSGEVYRRNGQFLRTNPQGYYWVNLKNNSRFSRYQTQKHKLPILLGNQFQKDKTEVENMEDAGYEQIWDCGQEVYLL